MLVTFTLCLSVAETAIAQDLAVNIAGKFVLRYRAANMLWCDGPTERPVVAECWSDPFDVYPANLFPGLRESTDLTKVRDTINMT